MKQRWKTYEEVAAYLLNRFADEFGLSKVEGKQIIGGHRSGTKWEIDGKGVREGKEGFFIIECRRYTTSKQNQEKLGSLAYRIIDTGAEGGILVSPLGIQEGAAKVAAAENVLHVRLNANSTSHDFGMQFLNKLMVGISENIVLSESVRVEVVRTCQGCTAKFTVKGNERLCLSCIKNKEKTLHNT